MTNMSAQYTPDVNVSILNPGVASISGVPSNIIDVVGTATWGPVNNPVIGGGYSDYTQNFGALQARTYDMGTAVAASVLNGGSAFTFTRITDGTDVAASFTAAVANTTAATLNAKYTGSDGNNVTVLLSSGGKSNTISVTVSKPNSPSEIFANIPTANFWANLANAVNNGAGQARSASNLLTVSGADASVAAPSIPQTYTLTGGSDGAATINATVLVGSDGIAPSGMYATRHTGGETLLLADLTDITVWSTMASYAADTLKYAFVAFPAGTSSASAISSKESAGIDTPYLHVFAGDWCLFTDTVNSVSRLVSPASFAAGLRSNLLPGESMLNKPLYGIVNTQRLIAGSGYSKAETDQLFATGIDLITNPIPYGNAFGVRGGYNASSNLNENSDSWTTENNFIAATLKAGLGKYVGQPNNVTTQQSATATVSHFLLGLEAAGILFPNSDGSHPWKIVCDATNNPQARTALGYLQMDISVTYPSVVRFFNINLTGGAIVVTQSSQNI